MKGRFDYGEEFKPIKLDLKDKRILTILTKDARTPLTKIAKSVKLSRDAVDYRIKRMVNEQIILNFFPNINFEKLGYYIFHVFFLIDERDQDKKKAFVKYLINHPNVFSLIEYTDNWDFEVVLVAQDLLEFDKIILEVCSKFPEIILEKNRLELIRRFNSNHAPPTLHEKFVHEIEPKKREEKYSIDKTDFKIISELSVDCTKSTYDIAKKVGVSSDTVRYRMKNLEKVNIIKNYTILLNISKLNFQWYTYTMGMKMFDTANEKKFEEYLRQNLNIIRSAKTLGGWDLIMYFAVESQREFHLMVKELKIHFKDVIKTYETWVAFKEHFFHPFPRAIGKNLK